MILGKNIIKNDMPGIILRTLVLIGIWTFSIFGMFTIFIFYLVTLLHLMNRTSMRKVRI